MRFSLRKDRNFSSPALTEAMTGLQKTMDERAAELRRIDEDIATLEQMLLKSEAPLFTSKTLGIGWEKWQKQKKRLLFADEENLGPIAEGTPAQRFDAYAKLPAFLTALKDHLEGLLSEEPLVSIVVTEVAVKRIGNEVP